MPGGNGQRARGHDGVNAIVRGARSRKLAQAESYSDVLVIGCAENELKRAELRELLEKGKEAELLEPTMKRLQSILEFLETYPTKNLLPRYEQWIGRIRTVIRLNLEQKTKGLPLRSEQEILSEVRKRRGCSHPWPKKPPPAWMADSSLLPKRPPGA